MSVNVFKSRFFSEVWPFPWAQDDNLFCSPAKASCMHLVEFAITHVRANPQLDRADEGVCQCTSKWCWEGVPPNLPKVWSSSTNWDRSRRFSRFEEVPFYQVEFMGQKFAWLRAFYDANVWCRLFWTNEAGVDWILAKIQGHQAIPWLVSAYRCWWDPFGVLCSLLQSHWWGEVLQALGSVGSFCSWGFG